MRAKRFFSLLLALCLLAGLMTIPAAAEEVVTGNCGKGLTWTLDGEETLTISGEGAMSNYSSDNTPWEQYKDTIRKLVIEDGVSVIGDRAFQNCTALTEVTLPAGAESIGRYAFAACTALTEIALPEGLQTVGAYAFQNCTALTEVTLREGLLKLDNSCFYGCAALKDLDLPNSLTTLGNSVFRGCASLNRVVIGPAVEQIGNFIVLDVTGLTQITVSAENGHFIAVDGILYTKDMKRLISVPNAWHGGVLSIPEGVETIAAGALQGCEGITAVTLPASLRVIENHSFRRTGIHTVTIPAGVTEIQSSAFANIVGLTEIRVEAGSADFKALSGILFSADGKKLIQYPAGRSGSSYTVPTGVTELDEQTFFGCVNLESVTIPEGVTALGTYAFSDSPRLRTVSLPQSIERIESSLAFRDTPLLLDEANWKGGLLYVGPALVAVRPEELGSEVTVRAGTRAIVNNAFANCETLTKAELPATLRAIPEYCFNYCTALKDVNIPSGVKRIERYAFSHCNALESADLPAAVTSIGDLAFSVSDSLKSLVVRGDLTEIGRNAFINCHALETAVFCGDMGSIGERVFSGCSSLKTLTIGGRVGSIGENAFSECRSLTDVYFAGSEEEWAAIPVADGNERLQSATIHYNAQIPEIPEQPGQPDPPETPAGDVNGDGQVNGMDVALLFIGVSEGSFTAADRAADVNRDGKINNRDVLGLFRVAVGAIE